MRARETGFIPQPGEVLLASFPAVLRFWWWSHINSTLSLSNQRLMLWDKEDERHSYSWAPHQLPGLRLSLRYDTDLMLTPVPGKPTLQIGLDTAHRNTVVRLLAQEFKVHPRKV
jgi:hypothetical protein